MSTRRSYFTTGVLLSALVLFGATATQAQTAPDNGASAVSATGLTFNSVLVTWKATADTDDQANARKNFEVGYAKSDTLSLTALALETMTAGTTRREAVISGLEAGKNYVVAVRAIAATGSVHQEWVLAGALAMTEAAPMPEVIRDRDIEITPGDMELTVEWDEPDAGHDDLMISEYMVEFGMKKDGSDARMWPHTITDRIVTIDRLENGMMYYVAVGSKNDAGGMREPDFAEAATGTPMAGMDMEDEDMEDEDMEDEDMEETPALPLVGILALFAGLLGAARARLRR